MPYKDAQVRRDRRRAKNRIYSQAYRRRKGKVETPQCFRCLLRHPPDERNCPLSAEYDNPLAAAEGDVVYYEIVYNYGRRGVPR